jgi:hypothetical protein
MLGWTAVEAALHLPARVARLRRKDSGSAAVMPRQYRSSTGWYAAAVVSCCSLLVPTDWVGGLVRLLLFSDLHLSQPGIGAVLGARVLAEFGDASGRYADAKSRKNYAGTAPITRQSVKTKTVHARFIHNDRLVDALHMQAGAAILHDPGSRAYYDELRGREIGHNAALRQVGNRLVGILHGYLKTTKHYNETTAWAHRSQAAA